MNLMVVETPMVVREHMTLSLQKHMRKYRIRNRKPSSVMIVRGHMTLSQKHISNNIIENWGAGGFNRPRNNPLAWLYFLTSFSQRR